MQGVNGAGNTGPRKTASLHGQELSPENAGYEVLEQGELTSR